MKPIQALLAIAAIFTVLASVNAFNTTDWTTNPNHPIFGTPIILSTDITKANSEVINTIEIELTDENGNTVTIPYLTCTPDYFSGTAQTGILYGFGDPQFDQNFEVTERISNQLTLQTANYPYDLASIGLYNQYNFHEIPVTVGQPKNLVLQFHNNTDENQSTVSITESYRTDDGTLFDFELFVFNAFVPAIPEFEYALIPIAVVLASFFLLKNH